MKAGGLREKLLDYLNHTYGSVPERPWRRPGYTALEHADNGRTFALLADADVRGLGVSGDSQIDAVIVKVSDQFLAESLAQREGFFRGYPMGRGWVSISLEGDVPFEEICSWVSESYLATASAAERERLRPPKEWIVPANPKYYDIIGAFDAADEIEWKQGRGMRVGDTAFMYVAAPYSAILFKCEVTETGIPFAYDDGDVRMRELMRIRLLKRYDADAFTLDVLARNHGVTTVRGPRGVPASLSEALAR